MWHLARLQNEQRIQDTRKEKPLKNFTFSPAPTRSNEKSVAGVVGVVTVPTAYGKYVQRFVAKTDIWGSGVYAALEDKRQQTEKEYGVKATITTYPYVPTDKVRGILKFI